VVVTQVEVSIGDREARTRTGTKTPTEMDASHSLRTLNATAPGPPFSSTMSSWTLSDVLGYISICCWLGAQFPSVTHPTCVRAIRLTPADDISHSQVIENARRKSVEGLSLPFLANWFLGMCRLDRSGADPD